MQANPLWDRYRAHLCSCPSIGLNLDISRMKFGARFFADTKPAVAHALKAMAELEAGAISNPDEKRQVGHYWLRTPELAPSPALQKEITSCLVLIRDFAKKIHDGGICPPKAPRFKRVLLIGIGGSALGPQLVDSALSSPTDPMSILFFDNTDPDGFDRVLNTLGAEGLSETLAVVISKSGGTKETRNGMLEAKRAYEKAGLPFGQHAVAVTQNGSALDKVAENDGWLARFPMWDWVGGRTSVCSAVGLLPAALQGFDIDALLKGARDCDQITRSPEAEKNPAMLLALMWLYAGSSGAVRDMVMLPYKDRLGLISRYLQQLIMESIGKDRDLSGGVVRHGISVYGNKGSTDQHAYVQQLREGINNFFVTFMEVLKDRDGTSMEVDPGVTSGDYLLGFLLGTRRALYDNDRESLTLTFDEVSPRSIGVIIALFERAVGFYASLVGINAYHQPGVEAGKKAAGEVIALQEKVVSYLSANKGKAFDVEQIASAIEASEETETIFKLLEHLAVNPGRGLRKQIGSSLFASTYSID